MAQETYLLTAAGEQGVLVPCPAAECDQGQRPHFHYPYNDSVECSTCKGSGVLRPDCDHCGAELLTLAIEVRAGLFAAVVFRLCSAECVVAAGFTLPDTVTVLPPYDPATSDREVA